VINMPLSKRAETLPERPGDRPRRLISSAVAITARRKAVAWAVDALDVGLVVVRFATLFVVAISLGPPVLTEIPLTVLTGFLGSGKTTLLKSLLKQPSMHGTAVIVNEFGEVGIDDALIRAAQVSGTTSNDRTVLLPSGCVCCEVQGDLVEALLKLHDDMLKGRIPDLQRVVLETTGLADPGPIARALISDRDLFRIYRLDGVIATVDAQHGGAQVRDHMEPARQIAAADRIILTKTDLVSADQTHDIRVMIRELNRAAPITRSIKGDIAADALFGIKAYEIKGEPGPARDWLSPQAFETETHKQAHTHDCGDPNCGHPAHHDAHGAGGDHGGGPAPHLHGIRSFCLTFERPLDGRKLSSLIDMARLTYGTKMLRTKGILNIAGEDLPFVVQGVNHEFYPVETLDAWPSEDRRSRLVFITKDLDEATVRTVFKPLL
jgi:G3E family GTPase